MGAEVKALMERAEEAKALYNAGLLGREDAKLRIEPYLHAVNKRSREIAKKYGQKPRIVTFNAYIR